MKKLLFSAAAICAFGISSAQAQSLNYGVMQEMFGEAVTTSANGSPMRASDAPLDMTIISAEEIARYPAREIPDILRHYAGVSVRQNTSTEYTVGVRGYNTPSNERLLVLVNGRQVFEDYFGLVNWSAIPVDLKEIRQIEVVRGPNTALFGFNATSGVINIVTYNPLYDDIDVAEADAGINGYKSGSGVYTWQNGEEFALRVSGSTTKLEEDRNTINAGVTSLRDDVYSHNFNADLALQLNAQTQMRVEIGSGVTDENIMNPYGTSHGRDSDNKSMRMNISSDTDWGIIDATVYRNSVDVAYKSDIATVGFENNVTVLQLSDTFKVGTSHTLRLAGEYRTNTTDNFLGTTYFGEENLNIKSVSGLWYWNINDKLSSSAALRYDHVDTDYDPSAVGIFNSPYAIDEYKNRYDEYGYNLGLVYKMTDLDTLRFSAAKGVDLPASFELTFINPTGGQYGNPNTKVSAIFDYQIGYERQLTDLNGKFKLGAFYQEIRDQQGFLGTTSLTNIGDTKVHGGEVSLSGLTDGNIRWGINYSYSKIKDDLKTGTNYDGQNSDHMVNVNLGYSPTAQWSFDAFATWASAFNQGADVSATPSVLARKLNIDPEVILDARIAYMPIEKLTLSLNAQAALGDNEQSAYGEEVDSQVFLRAKYEF